MRRPPGDARESAFHRLRQGIKALLRGRTVDVDHAIPPRWLTSSELALFRRLPAYDQAHSTAVARMLLDAGHRDRELIAAALLHDVGKAGTGERPGHVRLLDRTLRVLIGRLSPPMLRALTDPTPRPGLYGLYLAVHHPIIGGDEVARAGGTPRTCWLVRHHEDGDAAATDPGLAALRAADDGAV